MAEEFIFKKPEFKAQPIFNSTDPSVKQGVEVKGKQMVQTGMLVAYHDHPFSGTSGHQYQDLLQSVKDNGILEPLIVRPYGENIYEILAGHRRYACAMEIGLAEVPAVIMDVDEEEALIIVIETNFYQRSFADMPHSERAKSIAMHIEVNKKQGRRTDLINEVQNMLKASDSAEVVTSDPVGQKLDTRKEIAQIYNLSPTQITRYLRINQLVQSLKERIDSEQIAVRTGVALSYLSESEQLELEKILSNSEYKIDMKKAELMRELSSEQKLDKEVILKILSGTYSEKKKTITKRKPISISSSLVSKYFGTYTQDKQVVKVIDTSLEIYTANQQYFSDEQYEDEIKEIYKSALEQYFETKDGE